MPNTEPAGVPEKKTARRDFLSKILFPLIAIILSVAAIGFSVVSLVNTYTTARIQTYYEPMVLNLEFSEESSYKVELSDGRKVEVRPLEINTLRGFVHKSRMFLLDTEDNLYLFPPHKYDFGQLKAVQKEKEVSEIFTPLATDVPDIGHTDNLDFGTVFGLFEDFQGNRQLYMFIYVFDKETNQTKEQFIFDEYYLLSVDQETFSLPENTLSDEESTQTVAYIQEYLPIFQKLRDKLYTLNLLN